jgi:hypothetical protein
VVHTLRGPEVETKRRRPTDNRVWASVEKPPGKVIREAFEEALRRDPDKQHHWVVRVDGERKQLRAVKAQARRVGVKVTILVDVVHVLEYVWKAARAIFGESSAQAEVWVANRLLALLTGRTGGDVAARIRKWAEHPGNCTWSARRKATTPYYTKQDVSRIRYLRPSDPSGGSTDECYGGNRSSQKSRTPLRSRGVLAAFLLG